MDYLSFFSQISKNGMKLLVVLFCIFSFSSVHATGVQDHSNMRPTIFFDLGNTLVDTSNIKELKYFENAKRYVEDLKALGLRVALITNIPEKWGETYIQKIATLKKFIANNWVGVGSFDWEIFDEIIIPLKDTERKPKPFLYKKAISLSPNCPMAYISENSKEVAMARAMGFVSYNVSEHLKVNYLPEYQLMARIQNIFTGRHNKHCFDHVGE